MAYTPREIKDRVAVGDDIFLVEDLGNNRIRLIPTPTHVSEPGTPVNKALLQPIEDYLATGVVPVERTITAGSGLNGGGSLNADRTLSLGTPGTLSGGTTNSVTGASHTHAISVATQAEAEEGANNVKLMTPLRTTQAFNSAFNSRVVFAQVSSASSVAGTGTVTRLASSPTDYNTIKFNALLEGTNNERIVVQFPSLGNVVVGTPQCRLSLSSSESSLDFRLYHTRSSTTIQGVSIYYGIESFSSNMMSFLLTRDSGSGALNDIYFHFRFTGLKLS